MQTIYIETSVVSYLRSRPSGQVVSAARQLITSRWWETERHHYQLVTSQFVVVEAAAGDPELAAERLAVLEEIPVVDIPDEVPTMADRLLATAILPRRARLDALHLCVSAYHGLDYLLTWNCTHIANARILPRVREALATFGYRLPVVCTPEEMVDDEFAGP